MQIKLTHAAKERTVTQGLFVSGLISIYEPHRLAGNFAVIVVVIVVL